MELHTAARRFDPSFGVLFLVALAGCGSSGGLPRVAVEGDVTFGGMPLQKGSILFVPIEGTRGPEAGGRIEEGSYHLSRDEGPVVGRLRVEIRAERQWGYDLSEPEETIQHIGEPVPPNLIPSAYNDRSALFVETISEGKNQFDFNLSKSP